MKTFKSVFIPVLLIVFIIAFNSCSKNGYGCRGNSKIITRVR